MAVGADKSLAGYTESLQMYLMADAVSGTAEVDTVLLCDRTDKSVVIGVLKAGLKCIMIYVRHAALCFNSRNTHSLKLKVSHGSRSVLSKSLVDL